MQSRLLIDESNEGNLIMKQVKIEENKYNNTIKISTSIRIDVTYMFGHVKRQPFLSCSIKTPNSTRLLEHTGRPGRELCNLVQLFINIKRDREMMQMTGRRI